nr:MAG TPA: hypothetical protein [Caudoviricetes sp.]
MDYKKHSYIEVTQELVAKSKETGSQYVANKKPDTEVKSSNNGVGEKSGNAIDLSPDSTDSGKTNSGAKASKNNKKVEFRNLVGELSLRPYNHTMKVGLASTVRLMGFGKYLSGHYFVKKRSFSISGGSVMNMSLTVIKTRFGENLKAYVDDYNKDGIKVSKNETTKTSTSGASSSASSGSPSYNDSGEDYTSSASSSANSSSSASDDSNDEVVYTGGGTFQ